MNPEPRPPRLAEWILTRVVPPGVVGESILGDLRESFSEAIQSRGPLRARASYWTDALRIAIHRPRHTGSAQSIQGSGHRGRGGTLRDLRTDVRLAVRGLIRDARAGRTALLGLAGGVLLFVWASRYLESRLHSVSALDPFTIVVACGLLLTVAVIGAWLPARRATRVDPTTALRAE